MTLAKKIFLLILSGFVLIIAGFVYDVIFAGIPYQDPTPELLARYNFHSSIAGYLELGGLGMIILGVVLFLLKILGFFNSDKS